MDPKEKAMADALVKALETALPEAVETAVSAEVGKSTAEIKTAQEDIKKQIGELSVAVKMGGTKSEDTGAKVKKAHAVIANAFRKIHSGKIASESAVGEIVDAEIKAAFMNEGTATEGAEFVFGEFDRSVFMMLKNYPLINELDFVNIKSNSITLPTFLNTTQANWTDEGVTITPSKGTTGKVIYNVKKLSALVPVTDEMFEDNMTDEDLFNLIVKAASNMHAGALEDAVINGAAGKVDGIIPHAETVTVSIATGNTTLRAATAAATDDALVDLEASIAPEYETTPGNLVAIMSKYTLSQYKKKKNANGQIMYPELRDKDPMLLGKYRVILSSKMPVQNQAGDVAGAKHTIIGDVKTYFRMIRRRGLTGTQGFATGDFESGRQSIKVEQRLCGGPITGLGYAVLKNSAT
ncbi:MAG: phage major capsid protein [Patescibacteria group bacterium]